MAITAGKFPLVTLATGITLILAGCGLTQSVAIFITYRLQSRPYLSIKYLGRFHIPTNEIICFLPTI